MDIPFVGGAYKGYSTNLNDQVCQNFYPVLDQQDGKTILSLEGVPGLLEMLDLTSDDNLISNGEFISDLTDWDDKDALTGVSSWNSGRMQLTSGSEGVAAREQDVIVTSGVEYILFFDIISNSVDITIGTTSGGSEIYAATLSVGTGQTIIFTPTGSPIYIRFKRLEDGGSVTSYVDNVRLYKN